MKQITDEINFHGDDFHKPMTVFSVHDKYFLYNCWDSVYSELEKNVYEELRGNLESLAGGSCSEAAKQALEKGLWQWPRDEKGLPIRNNCDETIRAALAKVDFAVENLTLFVAQICNMRCRYCYGHGGTYGDAGGLMSEETAFGVLDWYAPAIVSSATKNIRLARLADDWTQTCGEKAFCWRVRNAAVVFADTAVAAVALMTASAQPAICSCPIPLFAAITVKP